MRTPVGENTHTLHLDLSRKQIITLTCCIFVIGSDRIFLSYAVVFGFLIPVLVNVVAANAEGTNEPLLEKHGINMWFFLVGIGGYCAALNADIKSRIHQENSSVAAADTNTPIHQKNSFDVCSLIAVVFGSLSTISLVSILVPRVIGYVILGIAWIFAAVFIAVYQDGRLIMDPGRLIYNKFIKPVFTKTRNWFNEATTSFPCCPSIKQPKAASNA